MMSRPTLHRISPPICTWPVSSHSLPLLTPLLTATKKHWLYPKHCYEKGPLKVKKRIHIHYQKYYRTIKNTVQLYINVFSGQDSKPG